VVLRRVGAALERSGAAWYYTWSTTHDGITGPGFVPMIWGADSTDAASLARAKQPGRICWASTSPI